MPYEPFSFPMTGGFDRTTNPVRSDLAKFYNLYNFRHNIEFFGQLETTPLFVIDRSMAQGTYNASLTEPTTSKIKYRDGVVTLSEYCAWNSVASTQMKVLKMTSYPTTTGVTGGCLLTLVNPGTATVNLNNYYEVEIDGATTFKWRVNGGAFTTLVAIDATNGNLIDGGAVRLYWLASSGFTVTDNWKWYRGDNADLLAINGGPEIMKVNADYYYVGVSNRIYKIEYTANGYYVRTLGYQPVTGTRMRVFENHLFITTTSTTTQIINSDLSNLDNFIATDVNEADSYSLTFMGKSVNSTELRALGLAVIQSRLFVLTTKGLYYTDYAGLPIPFDFKFLVPTNDGAYSTQYGQMLETPYGLYFVTVQGLAVFDGSTTKLICDAKMLVAANGGYRDSRVLATHLYYNDNADELIVQQNDAALVLQCKYGTFYRRNFNVNSGNTPSISINSVITLGIASRVLLVEDVDYANASGVVYGADVEPNIVFHLLGGNDISVVKETAPVTIVAETMADAEPFTYASASVTKLQLKYRVSTDGTNSGTFTDGGYWTSASTTGKIDVPRVSYVLIGYQLTAGVTSGTKAPPQITLKAVSTATYTRNPPISAR